MRIEVYAGYSLYSVFMRSIDICLIWDVDYTKLKASCPPVTCDRVVENIGYPYGSRTMPRAEIISVLPEIKSHIAIGIIRYGTVKK